MPRVTILSRSAILTFPTPAEGLEVMAVTYAAGMAPPRTVNLPIASYRLAAPDELKAQPRYTWLPKDKAADEAERQAIAQDLARAAPAPATAFDLP